MMGMNAAKDKNGKMGIMLITEVMIMKKIWIAPLACMILAGCGAEQDTETESTASSSSAVKQGCDAFEECAAASAASAETAADFKEEYEQYNGTTNDSGKTYRTITIPSDNPMVMTDAQDVVKRIENGDTFYVYFGDALCPWCRSVIETAISEAEEAGITEIDYVDIWDEEGNELLRDSYEVKDGSVVKKDEGTEAYQTLLQDFDSLLDEYEVSGEDDKEYDTGEKRIYAPTFVYIKDGKAEKLVTGISEKQEDAWGELTDDILQDEQDIFSDFFNN